MARLVSREAKGEWRINEERMRSEWASENMEREKELHLHVDKERKKYVSQFCVHSKIFVLKIFMFKFLVLKFFILENFCVIKPPTKSMPTF